MQVLSSLNCQNNKQSFRSIAKIGNFSKDEQKLILSPITDFSKRQFANFGEIHVEVTKPEMQEGFVFDCKRFCHDFRVKLFPMGKNSDLSYEFRLVSTGLDALNNNISKKLNNTLSAMENAFKWEKSKNPTIADEENVEKIISYLPANDISRYVK